jgi:hypothetical protein
MSNNCSKINLYVGSAVQQHSQKKKGMFHYLHQHLRVISCPLGKIMAIRKASQSWKGRNCRNTDKNRLSILASKGNCYTPAVNVFNDVKTTGLTMYPDQVLTNPRDKVVFKSTLDDLMK